MASEQETMETRGNLFVVPIRFDLFIAGLTLF